MKRRLRRIQRLLLSKRRISPFLRIVCGAGFLMSVSGCAEIREWPGNLAGLEGVQKSPLQGPRIDPSLRLKPKETSCLDPGKKAYEIPELEKALGCKDQYIGKLKSRFDSLAKASEALEK